MTSRSGTRTPRAMEKPITVTGRKPVCRREDCPYEGKKHPHCIAHRHSDGLPCETAPIKGTTRCRVHGGNTKLAKAQAEARAMAVDVTYGDPAEVSPQAALLEELYRTNGHVVWLGQRVRELEGTSLVWGTVSELTRPESLGKDGEDPSNPVTEVKAEAKMNAWLALYREERKHLVEVSKVCIAAGIAERQMRVIEAQAVVLAQVLQIVLQDARLSVTAPPQVQSAVVRDAMQRMELLAA